MIKYKSWEEARIEGQAEGRAEVAAVRACSVLTVLRVRGIAVPAATRKRILAQKDLQQLQLWLEKACLATSIKEVISAAAGARSASR